MSLLANNPFRFWKIKSYAQLFHIASYNLIIRVEHQTGSAGFGSKMAHPNQT